MFSVTSFEPKTLSWWYAHRKEIDVTPSYQRRGRVWNSRDKAFLIDSIINDFDIPKLYLADFTIASTALNEKRLPYAIIDGKQRLEAICEFLEGRISLNPDCVYTADRKAAIAGLKFRDLKANYPELAEKIEQFHLSVMRVVTDDAGRINELFVRLNRSKPLTGAEIRNAMAGPVPKMLRVLVGHRFFTSAVSFNTARMADLNTAAKFFAFENYGQLVDTKKKDLDDVTTAWQKGVRVGKAEAVKDRIVSTLDKLAAVFLEDDPLLKSAGVLPVYYWFVRGIATEKLPKVREVLEDFDRRIREARALLKKREQSEDVEAVAFIDASRSTNDGGSYLKRLEILTAVFRKMTGRKSTKKRRQKA